AVLSLLLLIGSVGSHASAQDKSAAKFSYRDPVQKKVMTFRPHPEEVVGKIEVEETEDAAPKLRAMADTLNLRKTDKENRSLGIAVYRVRGDRRTAEIQEMAADSDADSLEGAQF